MELNRTPINNISELKHRMMIARSKLESAMEDYYQIANYYSLKKGSWELTEKSYRETRMELRMHSNRLLAATR